jgi:hypothetical protein
MSGKVSNMTGLIAFTLGVLVAVVAGILSALEIIALGNTIVIITLIILGILIGALNITGREVIPFLLAIIALVVVGNVFEPIELAGIGIMLDNILKLLATLMAPAAVIVAIKVLVQVGFPQD